MGMDEQEDVLDVLVVVAGKAIILPASGRIHPVSPGTFHPDVVGAESGEGKGISDVF